MVNSAGPFDGDGEVAAFLRRIDWAATPLGAVEQWTPVLRTMAGLVLASPTPMALLWGPELVQLYNDAFAALLGDKHPSGLLTPVAACWPDVCDAYQSIHQRVLGGESVRIDEYSLTLDRGAGPELAWFASAWTPVRDGDAVAGILLVSDEITARKRAEDEERQRAHGERSSLEKAVVARTTELEVSTELLEAILNTQAVSVSVFEGVHDASGRLVDLEYVLVNAETTRMARGADLTGRLFTETFPGVRTDGLIDAFLAVLPGAVAEIRADVGL